MSDHILQRYTLTGQRALRAAAMLIEITPAFDMDIEGKDLDLRYHTVEVSFYTLGVPSARSLQAVAKRYPEIEIFGTACCDMRNFDYELRYREGEWTVEDVLGEKLIEMNFAPEDSSPPYAYSERKYGPLFELMGAPKPGDSSDPPWAYTSTLPGDDPQPIPF